MEILCESRTLRMKAENRKPLKQSDGSHKDVFPREAFRHGGSHVYESFAVDIALAPGRLEVAEYYAHNSLVFAGCGIRKSAKRFVITKGGS